ncbi:MAG: tyrosine-type recombinase/integrase [Candidatus Gracilibacteria bacterium]|nr:tyrosine-type recombinase/integrase [Candidatus Gracilibacteria bacterium]
MQFVEPIRDVKKISQVKNILRGEGNIRDLLLFELGINSALRISDLLNIKTKDLFNENLEINDFFDIKEEKTNKTNRITITPKVKDTLKLYSEIYPEIVKDSNNFIFFQKKTFPLGSISIGRKMSWLLLSKICKDVGLKGNFGNHTLRKTWGYQARMNSIPLEIIQHKLNHSSLAVTQKYLGITADEIKDACNKLDL